MQDRQAKQWLPKRNDVQPNPGGCVQAHERARCVVFQLGKCRRLAARFIGCGRFGPISRLPAITQSGKAPRRKRSLFAGWGGQYESAAPGRLKLQPERRRRDGRTASAGPWHTASARAAGGAIADEGVLRQAQQGIIFLLPPGEELRVVSN